MNTLDMNFVPGVHLALQDARPVLLTLHERQSCPKGSCGGHAGPSEADNRPRAEARVPRAEARGRFSVEGGPEGSPREPEGSFVKKRRRVW